MSIATQNRAVNSSNSQQHQIEPERHLLVVPAATSSSASIANSHLNRRWQRSLLVAQRSSLLLSLCLISLMLGVYAWTVYIQQMWSKEYRQLENLQRQERQMTAANEALKNQLAKTAENPHSGLVPPSLANNIFVPSAPQRQLAPKSAAVPPPIPKKPLGY
ncbi:MAG: hypothetical protein KME17_06745 [Cyanosarcina radialis HA8281-LM2]|jgi:cytoskeletal protein RodZ|nr:hypothetical protein [Cyanosarcina radialis HA8281-LM2]